ncbi:hypothetical protein M8C21_014564, partial [Ambrosia artemisiifolia]
PVSANNLISMEEILKALPQHTISWLKGKISMHKYQDFWTTKQLLEGGILAQQSFKAEPSDVFLCSAPKTGTTWLKSLAFAIVTREKFDGSTSPLLKKMVHECVPFLERQDLKRDPANNVKKLAEFIGYSFSADEEKVGVVGNIIKLCSFENLSNLEVNKTGRPVGGSLENRLYYRKAKDGDWKNYFTDEMKEKIDKLIDEKLSGTDISYAYEPTSNVKRLAEFVGYHFSFHEEKDGVVDNIIKLCSFENLSNLEVNKTGMPK